MEDRPVDHELERRLAQRLRTLRVERSWSLDELARRAHVSRASLSRLENGEVSPTAAVLGRLASAHGLTVSRLIHLVEDDFVPLIRRADQPEWYDRRSGFRRRSVSPPTRTLAAEVLECALSPDASITYDRPPRHGLEHHLLLLDGRLDVAVDGTTHALEPGDCLRYQLSGPSEFRTPADAGARYLLVVV